MLNVHPVTELRLSNNHTIKLNWSAVSRSLSVEVWKPGFAKDGHGYTYHAGVQLQGDDLEAFVSAIAALQEPEWRPAA